MKLPPLISALVVPAPVIAWWIFGAVMTEIGAFSLEMSVAGLLVATMVSALIWICVRKRLSSEALRRGPGLWVMVVVVGYTWIGVRSQEFDARRTDQLRDIEADVWEAVSRRLRGSDPRQRDEVFNAEVWAADVTRCVELEQRVRPSKIRAAEKNRLKPAE